MSRGSREVVTFIRRRLWWLDVIYPVALGLLLFAALSYIVYAGQRQWRLSLQMEKRLLQFGLVQARGQAVQRPGEVLVVSAYPTELAQVGAAAAGSSPDASIKAYGQVIEALAAQAVPLVFVHWDTEAHPSDDPAYVDLARTLAQVEGRTKVFFVTPPSKVDRLPAAVRQHASWLDYSFCDDPSEVQVDCSFVPDYTDWVFQQMLVYVSPESAAAAPHAAWVSDQLANGSPGYILNLSPRQALATSSFAALLAHPELSAGVRAAFLGADASHAVASVKPSEASTKVATVYDSGAGSTDSVGTPQHVFWAMVAQMFVDQSMIRVPSAELSLAFTATLCAILLLATAFGGGGFGGVLFLAYALMAPWLNAAALRFGHFYVPVFDSYYFGLFVLIAAGLSRLSLLTVERWRLEAESRLHARVADLKGNFVSLLSHNLNTPVAKMQGMLALLSKQAAQSSWQPQAEAAEALATQLEYAIRSVLIAAALEEGVLNETARTPEAILAELGAAATGSLRRLGIILTVRPIRYEDEAQLYLPLTFDVRAVTSAISSMAALFHQEGRQVMLDLTLSVREFESATELAVELACNDHWIPAVAAEILISAAPRRLRAAGGPAFFAEVLAALANLTVATYAGVITLSREGAGGKLRAAFRAKLLGPTVAHGTDVAD